MIGHSAYSRTLINTTDDKNMILLMLYDGAVKYVRYARLGIEKKDPKTRGENISKILAILTELDCALNREMAGDFIANLSSLYQYMMNRLTVSNLKNDVGALTEVETILIELKKAFEAAFEKEKNGRRQPVPVVGPEPKRKQGVSFAV